MHIPHFSPAPEVLPLGLQWKTSVSSMHWFWWYCYSIHRKLHENQRKWEVSVLMEKNFRITICIRTCCQCWGQKHFHLTACGHPLEHTLSHFPGHLETSLTHFLFPEESQWQDSSVVQPHPMESSWNVPYGHRGGSVDTTVNWCYRAQAPERTSLFCTLSCVWAPAFHHPTVLQGWKTPAVLHGWELWHSTDNYW